MYHAYRRWCVLMIARRLTQLAELSMSLLQARLHQASCIAVAVACLGTYAGPIEAASNTETTVMQAVQAAIIAAAAAEATPHDTNSKDSNIGNQQQQQVMWLDRTERLASSLGKMVMTVEQLNEIPHECSIMLMAGTAFSAARWTSTIHSLNSAAVAGPESDREATQLKHFPAACTTHMPCTLMWLVTAQPN